MIIRGYLYIKYFEMRINMINITLRLIVNIVFVIFIFSSKSFGQELFIENGGLSNGLKGYFSFDTTSCDFGEGKAKTGTKIGNAYIDEAAKYSNGALHIVPQNNESAYLVFENENSLPFILNNESELSIAFWVKPDKAESTRQKLLTVENGGSNYYLEITTNNTFSGYIATVNPIQEKDYGNAFAKVRGFSLTEESLDTWIHLAFTYDGDTAKIYVDGVLNWSENVTKPGYVVVPWDIRFLHIGNNSAGEYQFEGAIDELYIYNRTLDAIEVQKIKNLENPLSEYFDVFEVVFDSQDGSFSNIYTASPSNNYSVNIPSVSRVGYTFSAWNTAEDGSGIELNLASGLVSDVSYNTTYYAQWDPISYQINYAIGDAINAVNNPTSFTVKDLPLALENPTFQGQRFLYWFKDEGNENHLGNNTINELGDITLWPSWTAVVPSDPTYTDYCDMLSRDIHGEQYGFLAGNKMYYVAGAGQAVYKNITEFETLGFTHPMYRDGRARGNGIVDGAGGKGHDQWGWEFWRRSKVAYGTLIVNGERYPHPEPSSLDWRPDKMVVKYQVAGVNITEEKFISENDVLTTIITSDRNIQIEFEGESFYDTKRIPQTDNDIDTPVSQSCTSTINYNEDKNTIVLLENGTAMAKPLWGEPAVVGDMMYSGLHFVFSSNHSINDFQQSTLEAGNIGYTFTLDIPAHQNVALSLGVDGVEVDAVNRIKEDLASIEWVRDEKSALMNQLLNEEIPYFRCSDTDVVETYYFLWSLYFMYFTDIGEGWESYPHTQTAVNNFMGLHLWDSWAFCGAGSYVANKWDYSFGNALSWKHMVQYKSENNYLPDNFGTHWYSPTTRMNFDGAVGQIWKQYAHSGDQQFLQEAYYELLRPLFIDNDSKAVGVNEAQELGMMATQLGESEDETYWKSIEERETEKFIENKWPWLLAQYETDSWKNNWQVAELRNNALTPDMTQEFIDNFVLDTERGFISPNGINTRSADSPPNGIFRASSISCWLGVDGVFKQGADQGGIAITLNNYDAMFRDYGYPVAPEAWDQNNEAWGSRYYNWDIAMVLPIIEWIGGTNYSMVDDTFTYAPHLPDSWDFVEMKIPVVVNNQTNWVHTKVQRTKVDDTIELRHEVSGNPLQYTQIEPFDEGRTILEKVSDVAESQNEKGELLYRDANTQLEVLLKVGSKKENEKTLVWTRPRIREFSQNLDVAVQNLLAGTTLRYTTDGSIPTEISPIVNDTLNINETTLFTFKAFGFDTDYDPYVVTYENKVLLPDEAINENLYNGLKYKVFLLDEAVRSLPDFNQLTLESQGEILASKIINNLDFDAIGKLDHEHFGLHLSGFIHMTDDKSYVFKLRSDDGSILIIDGHEVVKQDGVSNRDPWIAEGAIGLEAGFHYIDLYYTQYTTRQFLSLEYKELGETSYHKLTSDMLYSREEYCLSFDEQGGSQVADICLPYGENILIPNDPVKDGYSFIGWYSDVEFSVPFAFPSTMPADSKRVYASFTQTLATDEYALLDEIRIYPNPVNRNSFSVTFPDALIGSNMHFDIYDLSGRKMLSKSFMILQNELEIDIADWPTNIYLMNLREEDTTTLFTTIKFILD